MNAFLSFLIGLGVATWVYSKFTRRTGNASGANNLAVIGVTFLIVFLFSWSILQFVIHLKW
jgi:hypothetical protein